MAELRTQMVSFPANGTGCPGYLARPDDQQPRPGVMVIQEWWGVDDQIKDVARRFADQGYVALAPDLYRGKVAKEQEEAEKLFAKLSIEQATKDALGAIGYLERITTGRIGVVGFCIGGKVTYLSAALSSSVTAAVSFYASNPEPLSLVANINAPVLAFHGEADTIVPVSEAYLLKDAMEKHGKWLRLQTYPGAEHAFFNDSRPSTYDIKAAQDAWDKTIAFLLDHLTPVPH